MIKIIFSILFLGTAIGIFLGPVKKNWEDINLLAVEKKDFNTVLSNSRELIDLRDNLIRKYNEIPESDLARLEKLIPSGIKKMDLVVETESLVKKYGFALKDIQVDIAKVEDKKSKANEINNDIFDAVYINLSFNGPYKPLLSFISELENDLRIMEIESLLFDADESDWYEYTMRIKTYAKK
ncbi:MAG: hypothetical protein NUV64_01725 [Parcubacteria group bacterium]|nr:hypothetical protein [Parcubacteria group bacterium]MCR4342760.1 hypothetical protein [Patescibacteria group bacterium]